MQELFTACASSPSALRTPAGSSVGIASSKPAIWAKIIDIYEYVCMPAHERSPPRAADLSARTPGGRFRGTRARARVLCRAVLG